MKSTLKKWKDTGVNVLDLILLLYYLYCYIFALIDSSSGWTKSDCTLWTPQVSWSHIFRISHHCVSPVSWCLYGVWCGALCVFLNKKNNKKQKKKKKGKSVTILCVTMAMAARIGASGGPPGGGGMGSATPWESLMGMEGWKDGYMKEKRMAK